MSHWKCYDIEEIDLGNSVNYIGQFTFAQCDSLKSITIPSSVKKLDNGAFYDCDVLSSAVLNEGLEHIGTYAFENTPLMTTLRIPLSVTYLGYYSVGATDKESKEGVDSYIPSFIIEGYEGSAAESYAINNGLNFTDITVEVTLVTLSKGTTNLVKGRSTTVTATIAPTNATNQTLTWTSSDTSVATVSNGKITAVGGGTATVTAKSNNGKSATVKVNVTVPVESITLSRSTANLLVGRSTTATATINPTDATNKTVTWTSSDTSVATVSNGKITAVGTGTATVTATTSNGKTATVAVNVKS